MHGMLIGKYANNFDLQVIQKSKQNFAFQNLKLKGISVSGLLQIITEE